MHATCRLDKTDIPKKSRKETTFRQTYGFVSLGWALAYKPSHLITPDAATATVRLELTPTLYGREPHLTDRCLNHSS